MQALLPVRRAAGWVVTARSYSFQERSLHVQSTFAAMTATAASESKTSLFQLFRIR
jgi:hypothetical protein